MILKEQAAIIMQNLNSIAKDLYQNVVEDDSLVWAETSDTLNFSDGFDVLWSEGFQYEDSLPDISGYAEDDIIIIRPYIVVEGGDRDYLDTKCFRAQTSLISVEDDEYDIQFYITDNFQLYNKVTKLDDKEYIPAILSRLEPFVPKSASGVIVDYLEIRFYAKFQHREALERIIDKYKETYHAVPDLSGTELYTQHIGKFVYENDERSQDGNNLRYFYGTLRIEWNTILSGVSFDQTSLTIDGVVMPVVIQTYRNDKSTIANKPYNNEDNEDANLVAEELVITLPLNAITASSTLWQDIHLRTYNKTYTIVDNYAIGGTITKTWELKAGIVNKQENKIVSFTCIFDIPLPRATVTITHKPLTGTPTTGELIIVSFSEGGNNSLDARMRNKIVKANELRQGNAYSISFIYEPGNEISKILAERAHRKVDGDRFDITYTFEDLSFTYENLVLESGSHAWVDNPGMSFTCNFVEGL